MPALAANLTVSGMGIKASEANTEFLAFLAAFSMATLAAPTRLVWPQPIPIVLVPLARTMALDLAFLTAFQANSKDSIWVLVGGILLTVLSSAADNFF